MSTSKTLTRIDTLALLVKFGVPIYKWILPDGDFTTVSPDWVTANCAATLNREPNDLVSTRAIGGSKRIRTFRWIKGCNDCENISLKCMTFGGNGNALSVLKNNRKPAGNLHGVCRMIIDQNYATQTRMPVGGAHAPNWFIDHDLQLRLHEPQGNVHLTHITRAVWQTATWGIAA